MSIASKLNHLLETKKQIKNAIINKGQMITDDTPFSSYASKINNIETNGETDEDKIYFRDYDGTLLYSYTLAEFSALTELPPLPTHTGLICQGWNWSLEDIKAEECEVTVGANYITDDGKTRIYVNLENDGLLNPYLGFFQSVANGVEVDWGDGSLVETSSAYSSNLITISWLNHTYSEPGNYVITLNPINDNVKIKLSGNIYGSYLLRKNTIITSSSGYQVNFKYLNTIEKIELGKKIESIEYYTFKYCYSLSSITIPNSVTHIRTSAFENCYSLSNITIPNSVISIESYAFYSCYNLSNIAIPNSVTSIGSYAFNICVTLSSITIPNGVTSIGNDIFTNCFILKINFKNKKNSNNLFIRNSNILTFEKPYLKQQDITIPDGVTSIETNIFGSCYSLRNITIPNGVTSIKNSVFYSCYNLRNIAIPNSVTSIGTSVFSSCYNLRNITIPNSVTSIGNNVFGSCYNLNNIAIPNSVTSIGNSAFTGCSSLRSITIPDGITRIETTTFNNCTSLSSIAIPSSVTHIGTSAFTNCYGMSKYDFSQFTSIPTLQNANAFSNIPEDCKILVPANLYDDWVTSTNWSNYADYIVAV